MRHTIKSTPQGIEIEIKDDGENREELLKAFGECQRGQCSCPTNEYKKLAGMDISSSQEELIIKLAAKPEQHFNASEIEKCLEFTLKKTEQS